MAAYASFRPRRPRWPWVALGAVVAAVIALIVWYITTVRSHQLHDEIFESGGERVGVTDGSHVFDQSLASIEGLIKAENDAVTGRDRFVTVALLTPMTSAPGSGISMDRIRSELEGAYVAQRTANQEGVNPPIRLVLANEGSRQQAWPRVVDRLVEMTGAPDHLVAVIGLGVSRTETADAARALSEHEIPMIGTLITADNLNSAAPGLGGPIPGLFRVNLSVADEFSVIADFLRDERPALRTAVLVSDTSDSDLYTTAMRDNFTTGPLSRYWVEGRRVEEPYVSPPDAPGIDVQFGLIAQNLCGVNPPDLYFYAGRSELLPDFVEGLRRRSCARDHTIYVVTGSDASSLPAILDRPDELDAPVSVIYPLLADPEQLSDPETNPDLEQYQRFERAFVEESGFDRADLADGWAIMTHDALLAARKGIERVTGQAEELPERADIRNALPLFNSPTTAVPGAGGTFTFDPGNGNAVGRRIPVVELRPDGSRIPLGTFDQPT